MITVSTTLALAAHCELAAPEVDRLCHVAENDPGRLADVVLLFRAGYLNEPLACRELLLEAIDPLGSLGEAVSDSAYLQPWQQSPSPV